MHGYFTAKTLEETVKIVSTAADTGWRLPLIKMNQPGDHRRYHAPGGRRPALPPAQHELHRREAVPHARSALKPLFGMSHGRRVLHRQAAQGPREHAQAVRQVRLHRFRAGTRFPNPCPDTDQIDLTLTADEGKQFFIRRIDFSGNTTTRDKVIRREILLDEGDMFNTELWDFSILRLNQLGYFEMLKKEDAADIKRNPQSNTVDITLKVKERGKNSIGLNGGVSRHRRQLRRLQLFHQQLPRPGRNALARIAARHAHARRQPRLHRTLLPRPSAAAGLRGLPPPFQLRPGPRGFDSVRHNLIPLYNQLGTQNLLNYIAEQPRVLGLGQLSHQAQLRPRRRHLRVRHLQHRHADHGGHELLPVHQFQRRLRTQLARAESTPATSFRRIPTTRSIIPISPTAGRSLFISADFAGSVLGGNVNTIRPSIDVKYFKQAPWHKSHILAFHADGLADHRLRR